MSTPKPPTVGIVGASGALGSAVLKEFKPLAEQGAIKLVILHRPSSRVVVPDCAEGRILDIGESTDGHVKKAMEDVDILIDASNNTTPEATSRFHTQLASAHLSIYVPADFTLNYARTPAEAPNTLLAGLMMLVDEARHLGLPVTSIHNGVFEHWLFNTEATGIDAYTNTLKLYPGAEEKKEPVTSLSYLAAAIRQIVLTEHSEAASAAEPTPAESKAALESTRRGPGSVRVSDAGGKRFTVVEYEASGNEIGAAIERVSGIKPKIVPLTDEECEACAAMGEKDPEAAINAGICMAWGKTGFPEGDSIMFTPKGVRARTLDDTVTEALRGE